MAMVLDWFADFARMLVERSGRVDFPEPGSEFWQDFYRSLTRIGATEAQADEASSIVCDLPNLFPNQYRPMVVEAVQKLQARDLSASKGVEPGSLDEARIASRECPDCQGSGFAPRYVHPEIHGKVKTFGGGIAPVGMRVLYPCSCPLGHRTAASLIQPGQQRTPLTVDQYPSLRRHPAPWGSFHDDGLDNQFRYRPDQWDAENGRPLQSEGETADLATLKAITTLKRAPSGVSAASREDRRENLLSSLPQPHTEPPGPSIDVPAQPELLTIPEDDLGWF